MTKLVKLCPVPLKGAFYRFLSQATSKNLPSVWVCDHSRLASKVIGREGEGPLQKTVLTIVGSVVAKTVLRIGVVVEEMSCSESRCAGAQARKFFSEAFCCFVFGSIRLPSLKGDLNKPNPWKGTHREKSLIVEIEVLHETCSLLLRWSRFTRSCWKAAYGIKVMTFLITTLTQPKAPHPAEFTSNLTAGEASVRQCRFKHTSSGLRESLEQEPINETYKRRNRTVIFLNEATVPCSFFCFFLPTLRFHFPPHNLEFGLIELIL